MTQSDAMPLFTSSKFLSEAEISLQNPNDFVRLEDSYSQNGSLSPDVNVEVIEFVRPTSSTASTISNAVNCLSGVGLLSLPFALRESGWIGLLFLVLFAPITMYTAITLTRCCQTSDAIMTYSDVGAAAFGKVGRIFIGGLFFLEIYVACSVYLLAAGDNFNKMVPWSWFNHHGYYIAAGLLVLPSVWVRDLSLLARLSWIGIIASVLLLGLIFYFGFDPYSPHTPGNVLHPAKTDVFHWKTFPLSFGLIMFGFVAHPIFPTLYRGMTNPSRFPLALTITYVIVCLFYAIIAAAGYLIWGEGVDQEITLNLGADAAGKVGTGLFVLLPFTKYGLTMQPVAVSFDQLLVKKMDSKSTKYTITRLFVRTLLVFGTIVAAISVPNFATPLSVTGSLCSFTSSITLPCLCYLKLCGQKIGTGEKILNWFLIILGICGAVSGTAFALVVPSNADFPVSSTEAR